MILYFDKGAKMKLLIAGSRSIKKFNLDTVVPRDTKLIISGGAQGMDTIAEEYADKHNISKLILRPQYKIYGKSAPLRRNEQMVDIADQIVLIWDGISKGAKHTLEYAKKTNKPFKLFICSSD